MYRIFEDQSIPIAQRTTIADAAMHHATMLAQRKILDQYASAGQKADAKLNEEDAVSALNYHIRTALQGRA